MMEWMPGLLDGLAMDNVEQPRDAGTSDMKRTSPQVRVAADAIRTLFLGTSRHLGVELRTVRTQPLSQSANRYCYNFTRKSE
jgi:hypothetical protein